MICIISAIIELLITHRLNEYRTVTPFSIMSDVLNLVRYGTLWAAMNGSGNKSKECKVRQEITRLINSPGQALNSVPQALSTGAETCPVRDTYGIFLDIHLEGIHRHEP